MFNLDQPREVLARHGHDLAPGLTLALTIAAAASFLSDHYGGPVMLFALLIGMTFNFLSTEGRYAAGIGFTARTVLRLGVALLGVRITFGDISALGIAMVLSVAGLIVLTIATGFAVAPLFSRKWRFALLTGGSVAICGASAALALAAVIPPNDKLERNTLFTVVAVTTLSTVAMIAYPILFAALGLNDVEAGFLIGATIHDVAQVVGAGYSVSDEAGEIATVVKLLRVALLPAVLLIVIACLRARPAEGARPSIPWFVIAFAALVAANSTGLVPASVADAASETSRWMLVTAISALGVKTSLKALTEVGGGHIGIVVIETLVLLCAALVLVTWVGVLQ
jgi:uncharacterized integral membrane protein (TIGR00698 family)